MKASSSTTMEEYIKVRFGDSTDYFRFPVGPYNTAYTTHYCMSTHYWMVIDPKGIAIFENSGANRLIASYSHIEIQSIKLQYDMKGVLIYWFGFSFFFSGLICKFLQMISYTFSPISFSIILIFFDVIPMGILSDFLIKRDYNRKMVISSALGKTYEYFYAPSSYKIDQVKAFEAYVRSIYPGA